MKSLLLISEDQGLPGAVRRALAEDEYRVWWAPNTETGIELLGELPVDLIIAEYVTPEPEQQTVVEALRRLQPQPKVLLTIGHGTPATVLKALRAESAIF